MHRLPKSGGWVCQLQYRQLLGLRGWTYAQAATAAGLAGSGTIARYIGGATPDLLSAYALARAFGVSLDGLTAAILD